MKRDFSERARRRLAEAPEALGIVLMGVAIAAASWAFELHQQTQRLLAAQAKPAVGVAHPVSAAAPARDLTFDWPSVPNVDALARHAAQLARQHGLQLRQMVSNDMLRSAEGTLAQADLTFELRSSYPALKAWLNDMTTRSSAVALVSLDLRQPQALSAEAARSSDVEATVRLRAFGRPTAAAGAAPSLDRSASATAR